MTQHSPILLSDDHVARVALVDGPLHNPDWRLLEDEDLDRIAERLMEGRRGPIPIFAYGSLIWNPGFEVQAQTRATALGWHRSFSISLDHFRGSPEQPGLMLALASGGSCEGLLLEIREGTERDSLRAILRRELVAHELAANACWIRVRTAAGEQDALTFYANPVDTPTAQLSIEDQARRLARASGAAGSGAEYLLRTVRGLEQLGIHDPYIWHLQHLVAQQIDADTA